VSGLQVGRNLICERSKVFHMPITGRRRTSLSALKSEVRARSLLRGDVVTKPKVESKKRILLVDDDESIREPVRMALLERGFEVIEAQDGREALICFERDAPDLMLLDLVMPERSGLGVLDRIHRSSRPKPRIIMLTANAEQRHRDSALERGVDVFMAKPFDIDCLIETVESLVAK